MVESTSTSSGVEGGLTGTVETVRSALASVGTLLRWAAILVLGAIWLAFWASLARHHLSMGNGTAVVLSVVPIVVPPVLYLLALRRR